MREMQRMLDEMGGTKDDFPKDMDGDEWNDVERYMDTQGMLFDERLVYDEMRSS